MCFIISMLLSRGLLINVSAELQSPQRDIHNLRTILRENNLQCRQIHAGAKVRFVAASLNMSGLASSNMRLHATSGRPANICQ